MKGKVTISLAVVLLLVSLVILAMIRVPSVIGETGTKTLRIYPSQISQIGGLDKSSAFARGRVNDDGALCTTPFDPSSGVGAATCAYLATSTQVTGGTTNVWGIIVNATGTAGYAYIRNGTGSGTILMSVTTQASAGVTTPVVLPYPFYCSSKLYVELSNATASILYEAIP